MNIRHSGTNFSSEMQYIISSQLFLRFSKNTTAHPYDDRKTGRTERRRYTNAI